LDLTLVSLIGAFARPLIWIRRRRGALSQRQRVGQRVGADNPARTPAPAQKFSTGERDAADGRRVR